MARGNNCSKRTNILEIADMEKWLYIAMAVLFLAIGLSDAVEKYSQGQCRVAAIAKGMTGEEVTKACK